VLQTCGWLDSDGLLLIEHESGWRAPAKAGCLNLWKFREYGNTAVTIYRR